MADQEPTEPRVQIVDDTLIDEVGRRWEFDFAIGWRTDVVALLGDVRPVRILGGDYADARELPGDALGRLEGTVEGGVYRSDADCIVYISE